MMLRYLNISLALVSFTAPGALRAATLPHAVPALQGRRMWTNDDLEQLRTVPGLISVVGQQANESVQDATPPAPEVMTEDPAWYAAQSARLQKQLESEQADLRNFTEALKDVQELNTTTPGVNLAEDNVGITPDATVAILQNRVHQTESQLDDLEDLARQNNIPPGVLRGQWQGASEGTPIPAETAVAGAEPSQCD
jgi:hypothetical protein